MARSFRRLGIVLASVSLSVCACIAAPDSPARRTTSLGVVVGNDDAATSGTYAWKGVPYARPPVAALRWKAPAEADPWTSPRPATEFAPACASSGPPVRPRPQQAATTRPIGTSLDKTVGAEDCLYLNIWRPATAAANLPVIVFVHGGSNVTGYTADPVYDGAALARTANVVVVTFNYRLGVFGFLRSPQLKTGDAQDDSGNFALLDIIKALQFVHHDIANFGGDPGNVTLMGQSAGAVNVYALMTSPLLVDANPPLVHRVIPLSGGISRAEELPPHVLPALAPPSFFEAQANALLADLLIADGLAADAGTAKAYIAAHTADEIAHYLRGKSTDAVLSTVIDAAQARRALRVRPRCPMAMCCRKAPSTPSRPAAT